MIGVMKITLAITGVALAGVITLGASTAALATNGDGTDSSTRPTRAERVAALCEHQDEIVPKLTERQAKLTEFVAKLAERRVKAEDAGRERAVARIDRVTEHVNRRIATLGERIEQAPEWIAAHCD